MVRRIGEMADRTTKSGKKSIALQRMIGSVTELSKLIDGFRDEDWDMINSGDRVKLTIRISRDRNPYYVVTCESRGLDIVITNENTGNSKSISISKNNFVTDSTNLAKEIISI